MSTTAGITFLVFTLSACHSVSGQEHPYHIYGMPFLPNAYRLPTLPTFPQVFWHQGDVRLPPQQQSPAHPQLRTKQPSAFPPNRGDVYVGAILGDLRQNLLTAKQKPNHFSPLISTTDWKSFTPNKSEVHENSLDPLFASDSNIHLVNSSLLNPENVNSDTNFKSKGPAISSAPDRPLSCSILTLIWGSGILLVFVTLCVITLLIVHHRRKKYSHPISNRQQYRNYVRQREQLSSYWFRPRTHAESTHR